MNEDLIAYTDAGGVLRLMVPVTSSGLTVAQIVAKDVPAGVRTAAIRRADLPANRAFGGAWELDFSAAPKIVVNMAKARAIFSDEMKRTALEQLQQDALDRKLAPVATQQALDAKDQLITTTVTNTDPTGAATVADLVAMWPAALGKNPFA